MIFWLFLIAGVILCGCFASTLGQAYLWYCIAVLPISVGLTALLSVLLGGINQYQMTKIIKYRVKVDEQKRVLYIWETDETLPMSVIDTTVEADNLEAPYLRIFKYELTEWRAHWLWHIYPPRYEYTLFLPSKDET